MQSESDTSKDEALACSPRQVWRRRERFSGCHKFISTKLKPLSVRQGRSRFRRCYAAPETSQRWSFIAPGARFFKRGRCSKNGCIREASPHDLKTHGQPLAIETAGNSSGRLTCRKCCNQRSVDGPLPTCSHCARNFPSSTCRKG